LSGLKKGSRTAGGPPVVYHNASPGEAVKRLI